MDDPTQVIGATSMALYMLLSFVLGGGTVLVAVGILARTILNSPVLITNLEHLANSASPDLLAALNATGELVVEATDRIPAVLKPIVPGTVLTKTETIIDAPTGTTKTETTKTETTYLEGSEPFVDADSKG